MLKFRDANPPKITWKLSFAKFSEKPAGHSKRLWPCTTNRTCVVVEPFPETLSNDIFWGKSKWMIPSTKWLVGGFWLTLLPSFYWWREDRSVQTLMDELDLPPDRANLFEAYSISCRATQMSDCVQTYWFCVYFQNQYTNINIQLHIVSILQPPAPSMVMGLYSTPLAALWWWCR